MTKARRKTKQPAQSRVPKLGFECVEEWDGPPPRWPRFPFRGFDEQVEAEADRLWQNAPEMYDDIEGAKQAARIKMKLVPSVATVELIRTRLEDPSWQPYEALSPERWLNVGHLLVSRYGVPSTALPEMDITRMILMLVEPPPKAKLDFEAVEDSEAMVVEFIGRHRARARFQGRRDELKRAAPVEIVRSLVRAKGQPVSNSTLKNPTKECSRPDQVIKRLMEKAFWRKVIAKDKEGRHRLIVDCLVVGSSD